jgi:hypothetical protein
MLVYFDTNIYDFIVKTQEELAVRAFLDQEHITVNVSDENILEILATPHEHHRVSQIAAIVTLGCTYDSVPQSLLHAEEVRHEIERLRPRWLRHMPSRKLLRKKQWFLDNRMPDWLELKSLRLPSQAAFAQYHRDASHGSELNLQAQQTLKDSIRNQASFTLVAANQHKSTIIYKDMKFTPDTFWRWNCLQVWHTAIVKREAASRDYRDWLSPYLKDDVFLHSSYAPFWMEEVDEMRMTKNRITALASFYQMFYALGSGNALDQIHASHINDVDVFLTADKRLHFVIDTIISKHFPEIQRPILIERKNASALAAIQDALKKASPKP